MVNVARIRRADAGDVGSLVEVHLQTVLIAYAGLFPPDAPAPDRAGLRGDWEAALEDSTGRAFLAEDDTGVIGTVSVRSDPGFSRCGQLRRLHVLPSRWDSGIGSALHDVAASALRDLGYPQAGLWVLEHNQRARAFYERRGWKQVDGEVLEWPDLSLFEVRYGLALAPSSELKP